MNILPNFNNSQEPEPGFFWPHGAGAGFFGPLEPEPDPPEKKTRSRSRSRLEKKSGAGVTKAGSSALR